MTEEFARMHPAHNHFRKRCGEHGLKGLDIDELYQGLGWARANRRDDLVECVMSDERSEYYRFNCLSGIFYAVFRAGSSFPVTVYPQSFMRKKKWAAKRKKRGHGRP